MKTLSVTLVLICSYTSVIAQFSNATIKAGLAHSHHATSTLGGGVMFFDANNDGWEDIYMTGGNQDDKLYINNTDGTFTDGSWGLGHNRAKSVETTSCISADFNRDGLTDIFLTTFSKSTPHLLLINDGDNVFLNISAHAGIIHPAQGMGATLLDYNHDGLMDIYVVNYVDEVEYIFDEYNNVVGYDHKCLSNFLYRNDGDMKFTEVSDSVIVDVPGCTLAATSILVGDDPFGLYVVNDFGEWIHPNSLLLYDKESDIFTDHAAQYGLDIGLYGMGAAVGDYDKDLDLDIYLSNIGHNYLMKKTNNLYTDVASSLGVDNTYGNPEDSLLSTSWSTFFFDYDNDSDLDLYVANGYLPSPAFILNERRDPNKLYRNDRSEFTDVSELSGMDYREVNRGAIYGDYDNDGDLDVAISTTRPGGSAVLPALDYQLFENILPSKNHCQISLEGVISNKEGIGALAYIYAGSSRQLQYLYAGGTHASQNTKVIHFGLGAQQKIDSIRIEWPSGDIDRVYDPPINERLLIVEGSDIYDVVGCMDVTSEDYNEKATKSRACKNITTSIQEIDTDIQLRVNPIPASDQLFINFDKRGSSQIRLETFTSHGQLVDSHNTTSSSYQLDISDYPSGLYILKLTTENQSYMLSKWIKK